MKAKHLIAALVITGLAAVSAQVGCKRVEQNTSMEQQGQSGEAEREVKQVERELADATVKGDTAALAQIFSGDCIFTGSGGEVLTVAQMLPVFKNNNLKFESFNTDDVKVRVAGQAAVVTGRAITKGRSGNSEFNRQDRFTRVYRKENGRWRLMASQLTPIEQQSRR